MELGGEEAVFVYGEIFVIGGNEKVGNIVVVTKNGTSPLSNTLSGFLVNEMEIISSDRVFLVGAIEIPSTTTTTSYAYICTLSSRSCEPAIGISHFGISR